MAYEIDKVETLIENYELNKACRHIIENLDKMDVTETEFLLGRIFNIVEDYPSSVFHLKKALENKKLEKTIYAELADVYEKNSQLAEAESAYTQLLMLEEERRNTWSIMCSMADFYKRNNMILKMERIGNKLIEIYPENYLGYHILFDANLIRNKKVEGELILNGTPERLKSNLIYFNDWIQLYENKKEYETALDFMDSHMEYFDKEYILSRKLRLYIKMEKYNKAEEVIFKLASEYANLEALVSALILMASRGEYKKAILLGEFLIENLKNDNVFYIYLIKIVLFLSEYKNGSKQKSYAMLDDLIQYIKDNMIYKESDIKFWLDFKTNYK